MYRVEELKDYQDWFSRLSTKEQAQVHARITRIRTDGHFGLVKKLAKNLAELKWKNGKRVYFTRFLDEGEDVVVLILGGDKNSQAKDITRAKSIIDQLMEGF